MQSLKKTLVIIGCLCLCITDFYASSAFSIHVNTTRRSRGNGSAERPFCSFSKAINALEKYTYSHHNKKNSKPVTIYIHADTSIKELLLITIPVKLIGVDKPVISFSENTGIFAQNTVLKIENCRITRSEEFTEPRTVPIIYGSKSQITLDNAVINTQEGGDVIILRNSSFFCKKSTVESTQHSQSLLIRAEQSKVTVIDSELNAKAVFGILFSLKNTKSTVKNCRSNLICQTAGKIAELRQSTLTLKTFECAYQSALPEEEKDAFETDDRSQINFQNEPVLTGFIKTPEPDEEETEPEINSLTEESEPVSALVEETE